MEALKFSALLDVIIGESEDDAISAVVEISSYDFLKERHLLRIVAEAKHESIIMWAVKILLTEEVLIQSTFDSVFKALKTLSLKAKAGDLYLDRKDLTLKNVIFLSTKLKIEETALRALCTFENMNEKRLSDVLNVVKYVKLESVGQRAVDLLKRTSGITDQSLFTLVITAETSAVRHGAVQIMFESADIDNDWFARISRCNLIRMEIRRQAVQVYWSLL